MCVRTNGWTLQVQEQPTTSRPHQKRSRGTVVGKDLARLTGSDRAHFLWGTLAAGEWGEDPGDRVVSLIAPFLWAHSVVVDSGEITGLCDGAAMARIATTSQRHCPSRSSVIAS
jgi:hypothetical protein